MRIAHTVGKTPANLLYIMRQFINFTQSKIILDVTRNYHISCSNGCHDDDRASIPSPRL